MDGGGHCIGSERGRGLAQGLGIGWGGDDGWGGVQRSLVHGIREEMVRWAIIYGTNSQDYRQGRGLKRSTMVHSGH